MLLVCLVQCQGNSQARWKLQDIVISVSGIQYDDPGFTYFRENIQNNRKVTAYKERFSNGTASIDFKCPESAILLWDELPASVKGSFQVKEIDDQHVALKGAVATANSNANDEVKITATDDCKTCYYNLCKYDETKTFQGVLYKGIQWDQGTYYYNCDQGIVTRKIINTNGYGAVTGIITDTLIMSNVPVGTTWGVKGSPEGNTYYGYALIAKNLSFKVNNQPYNDVIIVNLRQFNIYSAQGSSINYYYARGRGVI